MAKPRRVIRKLEYPGEASFDERLWPVNLALTLLGAFLIGVDLAFLSFHDHRWYANAAFWLALIPLSIITVMVLLRFTRSHAVRRTMQLALVISLMLHLVFVLVMVNVAIFSRTTLDESMAQVTKPREEIILPEYFLETVEDEEQPKQDFEKPLATETPQPAVEVQRAEVAPEAASPELQPVPVPEAESPVRPQAVRRSADSETVPRRSPQLSQLSRQELANRELPDPQVMVPVPSPLPQPSPTLQAAPSAPPRRETSIAARERPEDEPEPRLPAVTVPDVSRAQLQQEPQIVRQAPALDRSPAETEAIARSEVEAARVPSVAQQTRPDALRPQNITADRQGITAAPAERHTMEPVVQTPANVQRQTQLRHQPAEQQPTIAQTPEPLPVRQPRLTNRPDTIAAELSPAAPQTAASAETEAQLSAQASNVPRQATTVEHQPAELAETAPPVTATSTWTRRDLSEPAPPRSRADELPLARTTAEQAPASANQPRPPAQAAASRPPASSVEPAATAVQRAVSGTAGGGRSPNLDAQEPTAESPAIVASSSARREAPVQSEPAANALAPSMTAQMPRTQADQDLPSAILQAEEVDTAALAGAAQPAELDATASAALDRALAEADRGAITADSGNADIDLGPTRIVTEQTLDRADGGGQPEVTASPSPAQVARAVPTPRANSTAAAPEMPAPADTPSREAPLHPLSAGLVAASQPTSDPITSLRGEPRPAESSATPVTPSIAERRPTEAGAPTLSGELTSIERDDTALSPSPEIAQVQVPRVALEARPLDPRAALGAADTPASRMAESEPAEGVFADREPVTQAESIGELVGQTAIGRAEAAGGSPSPPIPGGGDLRRNQAALGPELVTDTTADIPQIAGQPTSSGSPRGAPLTAQGFQTERLLGGLVELPRRDTPTGPSAASISPAGAPTVPQTAAARRTRGIDEPRPRFDDMAQSALPRQLPEDEQLSPGDLAEVAIHVPQVGSLDERQPPDLTSLEAPPSGGPVLRESDGGLAVNVTRPDGPGGLGQLLASSAGITSRQAQSESLQVEPRPARFRRQEVGGLLETSTAAIIPAEAFRRRMEREGKGLEHGGPGSPGPETEAAIELGLSFLQRQQRSDGSWTLRGYDEEVALSSDTAATGLALLAFQGAGYNHREHKYADTVRAGLDYLISIQKEDGDLFQPLDDDSNRSVWLYSHSIAALALCEAYGMTQDPRLAGPAQRSLNFIVASQHEARGGWRYLPNYGSDTSVTGWMMMALKSGDLAGLEVPTATYVNIEHWLNLAQVSPSEAHLYRYNPYAPDTPTQRHGRLATPSMTAVGLLMRLYTGWRREHPDFAKGADYLLQNLPAHGTLNDPQRDTYYWYYATQVMFHMGGEHWERWNERLHPLLAETQIQQGPLAGSWDPRTPVPDRWGPHAGRNYVTTMNLLSLEVYYRHLPLYEDTAQ